MSGAWADIVCTCGKPLGAYRAAFNALKKKLLEDKEKEADAKSGADVAHSGTHLGTHSGVFIARDAAYENDIDLEPVFEMLKLEHTCCRMRLTSTFELSQIC